MKTIITGTISLAIGLLLGLFLVKSIDWNAITAIATSIMAICSIIALKSWKNEIKIIKFKKKREALNNIFNTLLELRKIQFNIEYKKTLPLLDKLRQEMIYLSVGSQIEEAVNKLYNAYNFAYYYLNILEKNNDLSEEWHKNISQYALDFVQKTYQEQNNVEIMIKQELDKDK